MKKYRKKPVVIEAIRFSHDTFEEVESLPGITCTVGEKDIHGTVDTLEGKMIFDRDHWIIRGVNGELYPCQHDIFQKTYESVS